MAAVPNKERIAYLDVARFIGMFCIYLGHLGAAAGQAYAFVFTFHVPLFFFVSGCAEALGREKPWRVYVEGKLRRILVPFFAFALVSLLVYCVTVNSGAVMMEQLKLIVRGCVRNSFLAGSLWFLSCLFVTSLLFDGLRRLFKRWAVLPVCVACYLLAARGMQPSPLVQPSWPYNVDSALYYLIFFAVGYFAFPCLHRLLTAQAAWARLLRGGIAGLAGVYAVRLFFGTDPLGAWVFHPLLSLAHGLVQPLLLIWLTLYVSRWLTEVGPLVAMGQGTLYLCGSEFLVKLLIPAALSLCGVELTLSSPLAAYVYTLLCLAGAHYLLAPVERSVLKHLGCG